MAPHGTDQTDVLSPAVVPPTSLPPTSRLSLDPTLGRRGAVDGGWWPRSRNASVELPVLVSSLKAGVGAVTRLGVDARDWDGTPRHITVGGHVVRIGRFPHVNHKIIVTLGSRDHIMLLVVPAQALTAAANSALAMAATGRHSGRPEEILAAFGIGNEAKANPPRAVPEERDHPREPEIASPPPKPHALTDDARRGEIGRWLDDGAPSPDISARQPN
jgi:hypothetical protein